MYVDVPLLAAGTAIVTAGVALYISEFNRLKRYTVPVSDEVTGYETLGHQEYDDYSSKWSAYYPFVKYCYDGQWHENRYENKSKRRKYEIGKSIELLVNPEEPNRFHIAGENEGQVTAVWCALFGLLFIMYSVL